MTEETKPTAPDPTPQPPTPTLPQLLAAWLEEHNAEIAIGVKPRIS